MATQAIYLKAMSKIGSEWRKGTMHRVYFNDLARWYGLEVKTYNSGNISAATLNGEPISNSRAKQIDSYLRGAKVWYDAQKDGFFGQNIDAAYLNPIVRAIRAQVEGMIDEMDEEEISR